MDFRPEDRPTQHVNVAIHCGDLTDGSKLEEFRIALQLLKNIDAPLKLVIAGNHDFTMDIIAFERKVADASLTQVLDSELVVQEYGSPGQARQLFEDAKDAGIVFLDEGSHRFVLDNGALLTVYASPYTPSMGQWGFQYRPEEGRNFQIEEGTDIAITHGPPKGVMDYTYARERAGCPDLFSAVARARPLLHCFGHIHEGWGAKLVAWKAEHEHGGQPTHFTAIDNNMSPVIEKLSTLQASRFDSQEDKDQKLQKVRQYNQARCCATSHCTDDDIPCRRSQHTLFVNASITDSEGTLTQKPWIIDMELPKAG